MMKFILIFLCIIGFPVLLMGQYNINLQGRVVSATDSVPLPGASVTIKGTLTGTITDAEGQFQLSVPAGEVLVISYIGYNSIELPVNNSSQTRLTVTLQENYLTLGEVEIYSTGYQEVPAERATGSFEHIDNELLNRSVSTDVISRLEGVTSGLVFNRSNIHDEQFSIRGRSTLLSGAAAEPLIILDNFPYDGDINNINPNDIESITVLKDAAAASIWGARSGNGVVIITTKKGQKNKPLRVAFNSNITIGEKPDLYYNRNYLNASDYIDVEEYLFDQGYYDGNLNSSYWPGLTPVIEILALERSGQLSEDEANAQIATLRQYDVREDFDKYVYHKSVKQQYALGFKGGTDATAYRISIGYDKNQDDRIRNSYKRFTINTSNTFTITKKFDVTTDLNYTKSHTDNNNSYTYGGTFYRASNKLYPYARLADNNGRSLAVVKDYRSIYIDSLEALGFSDWHYRPLEEIEIADNTITSNNFIFHASIRYKFNSFLNAEVQYQYQDYVSKRHNYKSKETYEARNELNRFAELEESGAFNYLFPHGGILALSNNKRQSTNLRSQINYNQIFGKGHALTALVGFELRELKTESYSRDSYGYDDNLGTAVTNLDYSSRLPVNPFGTSYLPSPAAGISGITNRYVSSYLNAAYTYDERYTLTVSGRRDGANIFGVKTNDKITPLWSTGMSWNISNENFYQIGWLPFLKLTTTYGYNGNVYNASAYLTASYLNSSLTGKRYAVITAPPNPQLRWERVRNVNLGIDFAFKKNILSGSIEWYQKAGLDLIEDAPLAPSTGYKTFKGNAASTKTRGIDISLSSLNINRAFRWQTDFLFSHISDKVTAFDPDYSATNLLNGNGNGSGALIAVEERPLFGVYSYRWAGLDNEGDPQGYLNGEVSKDYLAILNNATPDTLVYHGSARPIIFGSLRNTFSWRGFSLSLNIIFKLKYYFRRSSVSTNYNDIVVASSHEDYQNRWQEPGDERHTDVPALVYPTNNNRNNFYRYSDVLVERGDHIRLQDIRLSYSPGKELWKNSTFNHIEFYLFINNVGLLWKANDQNLDPDYNNAFAGASSYPAPRTLAIGIKAQL